jgi:hypothetical protein
MTIKTELYRVKFEFQQDAHCMSDSHDELEMLTIECMTDIGIDASGSFYMVLKTDGWSIDSIDDLKALVKRIEKIMPPKKKPIKKANGK